MPFLAGCAAKSAIAPAAIPTMEEEDWRRPSRERERLIGEQTRLVNRIKAILARFGVRHLRLSLRQAADRLEAIRTAERTALPHNTRAELHRFLKRLSLVRQQIRAIEQERERKLAAAPAAENDPHAPSPASGTWTRHASR
ncbi:hypothetical protein EN780_37240, partial [Mesorhizobium sp. M4B.F.Ca.ET.089.01.1.1]